METHSGQSSNSSKKSAPAWSLEEAARHETEQAEAAIRSGIVERTDGYCDPKAQSPRSDIRRQLWLTFARLAMQQYVPLTVVYSAPQESPGELIPANAKHAIGAADAMLAAFDKRFPS